MSCTPESVSAATPGGAGAGLCGSMPAGTVGDVDVRFGQLDAELPVVEDFDPTPGTVIERLRPVRFEVRDDSGRLAVVFVSARFPDGLVEVVHDGEQFAPRYLAGSARVATECGYSYVVRRVGGWAQKPVIKVTAVDHSGNASDFEANYGE